MVFFERLLMRPSLIVLALLALSCERRPTTLGFWFEDVSFESPVLGGRLTPADLQVIERVARAELDAAFQGLNLIVSPHRQSRYRVHVVQDVLEHRLSRRSSVAGESRAIPWLGGLGSVNFSYFASGAIVYAPPGSTREAIIEGIGRGLGRGAVHEFAHQLVRGVDVHASRDRGSYEYYAASRVEQYYGPMHWDIAAPRLKERFGIDLLTTNR
jgi:hypothetical protein